MRRHLNTLYVTTENAWVHKDGENAVVKVDGEERGRVPMHLLGGLVCFGSVGISPPLMGHCAALGVCISLMSRNGRFLARVEGPVSGNVLLRRDQYRASNSKFGRVQVYRLSHSAAFDGSGAGIRHGGSK